MKAITRVFLRGFIAIVPITITIYAVCWLGVSAERALGSLIRVVLPEQYYVPGLGVVAGLLVVLVVGIMMQAYVVRFLFKLAERLFERLPLVKTVYGAVKDLLGFFVGSKDHQPRQVVVIETGDPKMRLLGFVTRDTFDDLPSGLGADGMVSVYLPMSYQIGGFTVTVPRETVTPIDMTTEEALRFAVTAGMSSAD